MSARYARLGTRSTLAIYACRHLGRGGIAKSEEQREALHVLAEGVPGVHAVHDGVRIMLRHFVDS